MKDDYTRSSRKGSISKDESEDDPFQEIIAKAGDHGRFQLIHNTLFIMTISALGTMIYMNVILALSVPDHWCMVEGREKTNFSLSEWRDLTLPKTKDNRGFEKYSSCEMYDQDFTEIEDWSKWNSTGVNVTACKNGWSYDRTWYKSTIPSLENWVCSRDVYVTNVFVVGRIFEVIGSFALGQMGDILGRRWVYYISTILSVCGRVFSIFTTSHYTWFLIFTCLTSMAINSMFHSPIIVGMEISRDSDRSAITMYHNFGWSLGITIVPLLFWWVRDWVTFMWISTLPPIIVLMCYKYAVESPRWLITRHRFADAITQFKQIAKYNGREFDVTESELSEIFSKTKQEVTYGIASLFSGWRLTKNTCIITFYRCVIGVSYFTVVLFSSVMSGNPFLNFFVQSVAEIPAYFMGKYLGDKLGRRLANSLSFFLSFLTCIPIIFLVTEHKYELIVMSLAAFIKFLNAASFFTATLQNMEIYPTCMRQTGNAFGCSLGNTAGAIAPYLIYLGNTVDIRSPYYILGVLFLLGAISILFLPETLHKKLPDTMEEARQFGVNDKFFSFPKAPKAANNFTNGKEMHDAVTMEKLNQKQYAP